MGPPVAVGPGKKFRLSHPLSGPGQKREKKRKKMSGKREKCVKKKNGRKRERKMDRNKWEEIKKSSKTRTETC